jgi:outer membrane protein assembly factor BamD (BamD/ComL family)
MKKFLIFLVVVILAFVWAKDFVASGKFEKYLDEHSNEKIVPQVEYSWGILLALGSRYEAAIKKYNKVIEKYPKSDLAPLAMAAINDAFYELEQNSNVLAQGKIFLEKYPTHYKAEIIRRRMQFIQHGY